MLFGLQVNSLPFTFLIDAFSRQIIDDILSDEVGLKLTLLGSFAEWARLINCYPILNAYIAKSMSAQQKSIRAGRSNWILENIMADTASQVHTYFVGVDELTFRFAVENVLQTHLLSIINYKSKSMLRHRQPVNNQTLAYAYKLVYSIACFAFTIATVFTLPLLQYDQLLTVYSFFMRASALCMIAAQIIELGVDPVPKWSVVLCFIGAIGNLLYICSTVIYQDFNKGQLYIIAIFFTSFALQLKILFIIIQDSRNNQYLFQYQKKRLIKIGSILIGTIVFLISTIVQQLQILQQEDMTFGLINVLGGSIFIVSAYIVLKKEDHVGYAIFDQSIEIPTIL